MGKKIAENPIIILIGLLASTIAIFAFVTGIADIPTIISGTPTPEPTPTLEKPTPEPIIEPSSTPDMSATNWNLSFVYEFPLGYWVDGEHTYTKEVYCASLWDGYTEKSEKSFTVSSDTSYS